MTPAPRTPIQNPRAIAAAGTDAHLPPVPAERLTPSALRARFRSPPAWEPERRGDGVLIEGQARRAAAVLVPLVERPGGLTVLLTQRTAHLRAHAGHVAFPGGQVDPSDASEIEAALRETEEEVGIVRSHVEVLGTMPLYRTVTNFDIRPVVALVRPDFTLALDTFEVAEAFEVPLAWLMTPANHRRHPVPVAGERREFLSMPWPRPQPNAEGHTDYFIWGATASMLRNLYRLLSA